MDKNLYTNQSDLEEQEQEGNAQYQANQLEPLEKKVSHKQFWFVLILAIPILFFSVRSLYGRFTDPFIIEVPDWLTEQLNEDSENEKTLAELKISDTDEDGLSDYQELYQYNTSMFLKDTDSDGIPDNVEVQSGDDPLCPMGQSCNLLRLITPRTKLADIVQEVALDPNLTIEEAAFIEFRKFLLESGLSQEEVGALSNEDLVLIVKALEESQIVSEDEWNSSTTPEQVKAFLLNQPGVDESKINDLSEQELLEIRDTISN